MLDQYKNRSAGWNRCRGTYEGAEQSGNGSSVGRTGKGCNCINICIENGGRLIFCLFFGESNDH